MKTLEFIYQETAIHFLVNPTDANVMVNATEMAKLFDKKTKYFLKTEHAKAFIEIAKRAPNGAQIIEDRGRNGIYFDRRLALKFAAWLSPEFEFWIYSKIEEITFGNYKKHWEAHARQEEAKQKMEIIKVQIIENPTSEMVIEYFERESQFKQAKNAKTKAIQNQLKLFGSSKTST
jgi:hypothetical protein